MSDRPIMSDLMPNRAVVERRLGTSDDFPTPPWATRAFLEQLAYRHTTLASQRVLEPACGRGHMVMVLKEYFKTVGYADVTDYGLPFAMRGDFLKMQPGKQFDWVITNPPFKLAQDFIEHALGFARVGVAMLVRTSFLEGSGRYAALYARKPPTTVYQYVERVPMVEGRYDPDASTATSYCWVVWEDGSVGDTKLKWIPPGKKRLMRPDDVIVKI